MVHIQILMGVYKGTAHLEAQLKSLMEQDHKDWSLRVSDDSPDANSQHMIEGYFDAQTAKTADTEPQNTPTLTITQGPQAGFAANFMHMIRTTSDGFLALSDQDDIWCADKLSRAVTALSALPEDIPALYCARSVHWDGKTHKKLSAPFRRAPSFRNALIENIAQGNTIVLNPAATRLASKAAQQVQEVFAHDWWLYLLISGAGGKVVADNGSGVVLYRQHAENLIGSGQGITTQIMRKIEVLKGKLTARLNLNDTALAACRPHLTSENAEYHARFALARKAPLPQRLTGLWRLGVYRQRPIGTLGFLGASFLGRA